MLNAHQELSENTFITNDRGTHCFLRLKETCKIDIIHLGVLIGAVI